MSFKKIIAQKNKLEEAKTAYALNKFSRLVLGTMGFMPKDINNAAKSLYNIFKHAKESNIPVEITIPAEEVEKIRQLLRKN
jgi:hypothetical protein